MLQQCPLLLNTLWILWSPLIFQSIVLRFHSFSWQINKNCFGTRIIIVPPVEYTELSFERFHFYLYSYTFTSTIFLGTLDGNVRTDTAGGTKLKNLKWRRVDLHFSISNISELAEYDLAKQVISNIYYPWSFRACFCVQWCPSCSPGHLGQKID